MSMMGTGPCRKVKHNWTKHKDISFFGGDSEIQSVAGPFPNTGEMNDHGPYYFACSAGWFGSGSSESLLPSRLKKAKLGKTKLVFHYNGRYCIAIYADRGPNISTGRYLDFGQNVAEYLRISGGETIEWDFVNSSDSLLTSKPKKVTTVSTNTTSVASTTDETAYASDYGAAHWKRMNVSTTYEDRSYAFFAGSLTLGSSSVLLRKSAISDDTLEDTTACKLNISPTFDTSSQEFNLRDKFDSILGVCNNVFLSEDEEDYVGMLTASENEVSFVEYTVSSKSTVLKDLSDYTYALDISHTDGGDPSTLSLSFDNTNPENSIFKDNTDLYQVLPTRYSDHANRLIAIDASFDQGSYSYVTRLFFGTVYALSTSRQKESEIITVTAYDLSKTLQNQFSPYSYTFANEPALWGESASDYQLVFKDGVPLTQSLRPLDNYTVTNQDTQAKVPITVGWDLGVSSNTSEFSVDVVAGRIKESGTMGSTAFVPSMGSGEYQMVADFSLDTFDTVASIGFGSDEPSRSSACAKLEIGLTSGGGQVHLKATGMTTTSISATLWKTLDTQPMPIERGRVYTATITCTESGGIQASLVQKDNPSVGVKLSYGTLKGNASLVSWTCLKRRRCFIGASPQTYGNAYSVKWDGLVLLPNGNTVKDDQTVAEEIVSMGFQGIIPLKKQPENLGEYFTACSVYPNSSLYDALTRLSVQNAKRWNFDYDGTFVWKPLLAENAKHYLVDADIENISVTYNPGSYTNWVEVANSGGSVSADGLSSSPSGIPDVRFNIIDSESVLRDGIRYNLIGYDASSAYTTVEQAQRMAYDKYFGKAEDMETVSVSLTSPLVFIQPRDTVILNSDIFGYVVDSNDNAKYFTVSGISIQAEGTALTLSATLSSRVKAMMESEAKYFETGLGVTSSDG